jgi:hypothetical protein
LTAEGRAKVNAALKSVKQLAAGRDAIDKGVALFKAEASAKEGDEAAAKDVEARRVAYEQAQAERSKYTQTDEELLQAAKAAIRPLLTEAQFNRIDDLVREWIKDDAAYMVRSWLARLELQTGPVTGEQRTQVEAVIRKAQDKLGVLMSGGVPTSYGRLHQPDYFAPTEEARWQIYSAILTGEQKAKLPESDKPRQPVAR